MVLHGDSLVRLREMQDCCIDLVVTSPPYDELRAYSGAGWDFQGIAKELWRTTKPGGVVVWVVSDGTVNGSETGSSFRQALFFKDLGFNLHDTMAWLKGTAPFQHRTRYIGSFDYMFVFSKGRPRTVNLIKDRRNKWGGTQVHGTERWKSGIVKPRSVKQKSKLVKDFGARLNAWEIPPEKNNETGHPAVFPVKLAEDHIATWSNAGDVVLDPFMGSGTTGVAALKLGRDFIGIDVSAEYVTIAEKRLAHAEQE